MESSVLKLKFLSCKDLRAFNFFQKLTVYAVVSLYSDDPAKKLENTQEQRTRADEEGDGNPEWNHEMEFDLSKFSIHDCDHIFLKFEMKHSVFLLGDNHIGEVRVPLKDLIQQADGVVRFMSYEVRGGDRKSNGVLNFSCQVTVRGNFLGVGTQSLPTHVAGFPPDNHHHYPEVQYQGYGESTNQSLYPQLSIEDIYPATCSNYASSSSYYPPTAHTHIPAPSQIYPPLPELPVRPPPPPPHMMTDGGYHPPPGLPQLYLWGSEQYSHLYGYGFHVSQGKIVGHQHHSAFGDGERLGNGKHG